MSIVSTRADRRTILIVDQDRICAEPPPDVAEAFSSQMIAKLATDKVGLAAGSAVQTALMQLAQRSQGLEYFRTASFVFCNMYVINQKITLEQYNWYMANAAAEAVKLMAQQIEKGSLPGVQGHLNVTGATTLNIDAKTLDAPKSPQAATPAPPTAGTSPNSSPVPPPAVDDKALPKAKTTSGG